MSEDTSILPTFSPKKCGMGHILGGWGIPFMCRLSNFLHQLLMVVHHSHSNPCPAPHLVVPSAASSTTFFTQNSYFAVLCSFPLCWTLSAISHLSSAGRHLLRQLHIITLFHQAFPAPFFMDAKMGGVVPRQLLAWKFHISSWGVPWSTSIA